MIVVIQCAAKKQPNAGHLRARSGKPVLFVAYPHAAPPAEGIEYAHPDAPTDTGLTWREVLDQYNLSIAANPLGLLRAVDLYVNPIYRRIVERFGLANTYILSAGWGLISADFSRRTTT